MKLVVFVLVVFLNSSGAICLELPPSTIFKIFASLRSLNTGDVDIDLEKLSSLFKLDYSEVRVPVRRRLEFELLRGAQIDSRIVAACIEILLFNPSVVDLKDSVALFGLAESHLPPSLWKERKLRYEDQIFKSAFRSGGAPSLVEAVTKSYSDGAEVKVENFTESATTVSTFLSETPGRQNFAKAAVSNLDVLASIRNLNTGDLNRDFKNLRFLRDSYFSEIVTPVTVRLEFELSKGSRANKEIVVACVETLLVQFNLKDILKARQYYQIALKNLDGDSENESLKNLRKEFVSLLFRKSSAPSILQFVSTELGSKSFLEVGSKPLSCGSLMILHSQK